MQGIQRPIQLFQHSKRDEWGVAILARDGGDRQTFQFEDGRARTFSSDYLHLLEPVDKPVDQRVDLVRTLKTMLGRREETKKSHAGATAVPWDAQLMLFNHLFEDGFAGEKWQKDKRGSDGRRLKRHRDPAIEAAQTKLSAKAMGDLSNVTELRDAISAIVEETDLITPKERRRFTDIDDSHARAVVTALHDVLHGDSPLAARFDTWVRVLGEATGETIGWEMATVLPALVDPQEFVCVKPTVFDRQARWMAPGLVAGTRPEGATFDRLCRMVSAVRERLIEAELPPKDLLDVRDFIWETLRPAALREIEILQAENG